METEITVHPFRTKTFARPKARQQAPDTARYEVLVRRRGLAFKSWAEFNHAVYLQGEVEAGRVKKWKHESEMPAYALVVRGREITTHRIDFTVWLPDGRKEVHGVKGGNGTENEADRLRVKLFRALHPNIRYRTFKAGYLGRWKGKTLEYSYAAA